MQETIKTVLLDADGVIQTDSPEKRAAFERACGDLNRIDDFIAEVFDAEYPFLIGDGDFPSKLREIVNRWGGRASLSHCLEAWTAIEPNCDVLKLVAEIRHIGLPVGIASSQEAYRANHMSTALGYKNQFDYEFYSCEIGFVKPDKSYFESILQKLALPPSSILFLDDNQPIVDAALECGLTAFRFDLKQNSASDMRAIFVECGLVI